VKFLIRNAAALAAAFAVMPVAHAAIELTQQSALVQATIYAGPGAMGAASPDSSQYQSVVTRLPAPDLTSASLAASAEVSNQLTLSGDARYASTVGPDGLSLYSEFSFGQTRNVTNFSATMAAGVDLRAQGRMIFSVSEDTVVSLSRWQSITSKVGFVPQSMNFQSQYSLERIIGATDGIDPITGLPAVLTIAVGDLNWAGDTLLTAGNYMLSVNNLYVPAAWSYQTQTFDLSTGTMVTSINANPGFYGDLKASSGITLRAVTAAVPEPGAWALMALGLTGLMGAVSTKRRQRPPATH
jgi:hypothetical protein